MQPNTALKDAVFAALRPHLGRYNLSGSDRGIAFYAAPKSFALTAEGLPAGIEATGLEAIFALFPDPSFNAEYEFGDGGQMKGVLYHALTLKAWTGSVMPAYDAVRAAFPLMTLSSHRQPRQVPTDLNEALAVWVPIQT